MIGSTTSWTWAAPAASHARSWSAISAGEPVTAGTSGGRVVVAHLAAGPAWQPDVYRGRRLDLTGRPPRVTINRSTRSFSRANPSAVLPYWLHHMFHAATWGSVMSSMRSPIEPTISGGPPGRGERGWSTQRSAS